MMIAFRVDASSQIGTGHVIRCLTLAEMLKSKGAHILFVCREHSGNLCDLIASKGFEVFSLRGEQNTETESAPKTESIFNESPLVHAPWLGVGQETDANQTLTALQGDAPWDWLIVDHYALDYRWESAMRKVADKIMVIYDLADRKHECDLLLDQNYYNALEKRYEGLVPECCQTLLGPKYALLRPVFRDIRGRLKRRNGKIKRILIFFGGMDITNETAKTLDAIDSIKLADIIAIDVVVGSGNPHKNSIKELCNPLPNVNYHCQVENMAELMGMADLSIGGGGGATWERCCLMLPTLIIALAFNQIEIAKGVSELGAAYYLGCSTDVTEEVISKSLHSLIVEESELLINMISSSGALVDGKGANRVSNAIGVL